MRTVLQSFLVGSVLGMLACNDAPLGELPVPDSGVVDAEVQLDAVASYDPGAVIEAVAAGPPAEANIQARTVRLRVWNTEKPNGDRTNIRLVDAEVITNSVQLALTQCEDYGWPIHVVLESVGVVQVPAQCFEPVQQPTAGTLAKNQFKDCQCPRFYFGNGCGVDLEDPIFYNIGSLGRRINGYVSDPGRTNAPPLGADEHGQIDLVFVKSIAEIPVFGLAGIAGSNPSRTLLLREDLLRFEQGDYLTTAGHELGHCVGGYPSGHPDSDFAHVDRESLQCQHGDDIQNHVMCNDSGMFLDEPACRYWFKTIGEHGEAPRNYTEVCDGADNDLDGQIDEAPDCQ